MEWRKKQKRPRREALNIKNLEFPTDYNNVKGGI